jgi:hypothetical protein
MGWGSGTGVSGEIVFDTDLGQLVVASGNSTVLQSGGFDRRGSAIAVAGGAVVVECAVGGSKRLIVARPAARFPIWTGANALDLLYHRMGLRGAGAAAGDHEPLAETKVEIPSSAASARAATCRCVAFLIFGN